MEGLWGKKIGMTQVFSEKKQVVPVTAIDVSNWYITQVKTNENDGYNAVKMGYIKDKYSEQDFSEDWLNDPKKYFKAFKEVKLGSVSNLSVGQQADLAEILSQGDNVDVFGVSKGSGFQGVVKRHGFSGGSASHGATFGRFPGSLSFMTSQGRVPKGKAMPGHMGVQRNVMKNLEIIKVESNSKMVLVKGSIPGKSGSLVFIRKSNLN